MSGTDSSPRGRRAPGYDSLISTAALYEDPDRAFLRVGGDRAARALNGLTSADVEALGVHGSTLAFILTSKGHPVAVPTVVRLEDAFLLDVSRAALPGLLAHFAKYLPPRFASVVVLDAARRISLLGPRAAEVMTALASAGSEAEAVPAPAVRVLRPEPEGGGFDFLFPEGGAPVDDFARALRALGAIPASEKAFETWRIEMGIPRFGRDITAENLPQETGLVDRAVSFDKGCYTGQEVVARIHYRGRIQRHLRGVEALEPPAATPVSGTPLSHDSRSVGAITSWCESPRFGSIGLAYVRRELGAGHLVRLESTPPIPCRVRDIPFTA